jgi:hypothetical protein
MTHLRPCGALAVAGCLWDTGFLFGKIALAELAVPHMILYRLMFACGGFLPLAFARGLVHRREDWLTLSIAAALGVRCVSHSVWSCGNRFGCQVAQHLKSSTRARPESWTPARASKPERAKELSASLVRRFVRLLDDNRREPNVTLALRLTIICSVTLMALAGSLSSVDKSKSSYGRARLADRAI